MTSWQLCTQTNYPFLFQSFSLSTLYKSRLEEMSLGGTWVGGVHIVGTLGRGDETKGPLVFTPSVQISCQDLNVLHMGSQSVTLFWGPYLPHIRGGVHDRWLKMTGAWPSPSVVANEISNLTPIFFNFNQFHQISTNFTKCIFVMTSWFNYDVIIVTSNINVMYS